MTMCQQSLRRPESNHLIHKNLTLTKQKKQEFTRTETCSSEDRIGRIQTQVVVWEESYAKHVLGKKLYPVYKKNSQKQITWSKRYLSVI